MNSNAHRRQKLEDLIHELSVLDERRAIIRDEIQQLLADIQEHEMAEQQIVYANTAEEFYLHGDRGKSEEEQYCYIGYLGKSFKCCRRFWGVLLGRTQDNALWEMHVDAWIRRAQHVYKKIKDRGDMSGLPRYVVMPTFFNNDFVEFKWERIVKAATGDLKIFPPWWEVDVVLIPVSCPNDHWFLLQIKISTLELTVFDRELAMVPDAHRSRIMYCYEENLIRFLEVINYMGRGPTINAKKPFGYVARVTQYPDSRQHSALLICLFIHYILTGETRETFTADVSNELVEQFRSMMAKALYAKRSDLNVG